MKNTLRFALAAVAYALVLSWPAPGEAQVLRQDPVWQLPKFTSLAAKGIAPISSDGSYIIIGWNDLGMHCISPRFAEMAILPPYNNLRVLVLRRGDEPRVVTSGVTVSYSLLNNTTVKGKTDFWSYVNKLFGVSVPAGMGLAGNGLSGNMKPVGGVFAADGVPVLPYNDDKTWNPFQRANITLKVNGKTVATTAFTVPISDEMNCAKCHKNGGAGAKGIRTATVEGNILTLHDQRSKTKLMASRPVLCASCHSDNALGTKGVKGVRSLSYSMHTKHSWARPQPACYDCHPGAKTQCNRSAAQNMGPVGNDPRCDNCHGDLDRMAASLRAGRKPWLEEPTCASCHGNIYSTGATLYRNARGHGGVLCIACHNSPHAWYPSKRADDNVQPLTLQNSNKALGYNKCSICHNDNRRGRMPPHQDD